MKNVCAIVLAAGMSRRMGKPKQLLKLNGDYVINKVIQKVVQGPFHKIIIVTGYQSDEVKRAVSTEDKRLIWTENKAFASGQSSSLRKGLAVSLDCCSSTMVFLGDVPFISDDTIQKVYETGMEIQRSTSAPFRLQPAYKLVPGHPVFLGHTSSGILKYLEGDENKKGLKNAIRYHDVLPVDDPGSVFDIDIPADYFQALKYVETGDEKELEKSVQL